MLNGISSLITPEIYRVIYTMGHLDELAIVDGNYGEKYGSKNNRIFHSIQDNNRLLTEILRYLPLDEDERDPVQVFIPDYYDTEDPPAWEIYQKTIDLYYENGRIKINKIGRKEFYGRTSEAYATIKTLDQRPYANIIVRKGFVLNLEDSINAGAI
ncbi:MAG: hypothetical protein HC888_04550 [Candidatus Competibacteraceae bacterium]|nr:hypothetical protein [Candidatus Competibacteraceae bacterium]